MTAHRIRAYIYLLIVALVWGIAGPVIKFTLGGIAPLPFLTYRFAISALIGILYFLIKGFRFPNLKKTLPLAIIYSLLAFPVALMVLFLGLDKTGVLDMSLITLLAPLLVAIGGVIFFKDHITKREKVGILIVLTGVLFTTFYPIINGDASSIHLFGNVLIFVFLFADSIATLLAKKLVQQDVPPLALTNLGFVIGAVVLIPVALSNYGFSGITNLITTLPVQYHLGVLYMAILSGTTAYFLWVLAQKSIEVSEAALFRYLGPVFGVPLAIVWLGEKITPYFIVGAVLIAIGVIIAEIKRKS